MIEAKVHMHRESDIIPSANSLKLVRAVTFLQSEDGPQHSNLWCACHAVSAHITLAYNAVLIESQSGSRQKAPQHYTELVMPNTVNLDVEHLH